MKKTTVRSCLCRLAVKPNALLALISLSPLTLPSAPLKTLPGHVPVAASTLVPVGRLEPTRRVKLAIGLPLRNREVLTNLLQELYNPASPQFRQFLTPQQFTEFFGPTPQDYQAVADFARTHGFEVTQTYGNRVILDVSASVADIEKTFHLTLQTYQHPDEPRLFYAPSSEPQIEGVVPILDISGLDDYKLPKPLVHKLAQPSSSQAQPQSGSGPGGTYRGNDFRAAYAPSVAANGFGQTVGLLEFDGFYTNDIASYESQSGLPFVPLSTVLLDGYNGTPGGANIEVALDIEVAIAMAPGLSQVIVYEAGPSGLPNDILTRMVSDNLAKQISSSWTWGGSPSSDSLFQQMAAQGQSFFQASGDSDAYTSTIPQPADSPYITVVGGTTLSTGAGGAWASETTWNWFTTGGGTNGSSGGISTSYSIPTWQQSISMSANQGSTTMRNIPDVALTADNVWVVYNNGSSSGAVGGTSCAAPLWAGFTALINQQSVGNGNQPVGFLNPSLYSIASGSGYSSAFHDITTGNNTNKASSTKFFATTGYDLCTGLGTPAGSGLINALAGPATAQIVSNSMTITAESCSNNAVDPGETVTINFGLVNSGTANTTNLVATLVAGGGVTSPSAAQTYGVLTAGGTAVSRPFTFTANGSCGGLITASLQLQDGASSLGTLTFTMRLGAAVSATTFTENFDGVTAPALPATWSTAVASGLQSTWYSTNGVSDSAPNSAFAPDSGNTAQTELVSPTIPISSTSAQLTFRQYYNLAFRTTSHPRTTTYYDGGVLLISIGGGAFSDIITAGGSFVTGGYNCTLSAATGNPLSGMQAWGSSSPGWTTTTVTLPASAAGQNIQLKWALGTCPNTSVAEGWFIDSVSIQDSSFNCCSPNADVSVTQAVAPNPGSVGQNLVYTLKVLNAGPSPAANVAVTDSLPSSVTFISASPGCINLGGSIACTIGSLASGTTSNIVVTVQPAAEASLTNTVTVSATTPDPNTANNTSTSTLSAYIPPGVTAQPTNQIASVGGGAAFYVSASGSAPLSYQWKFNGASLASATASALLLSNVQANQAGNYIVVVTNPSGSVTSTVATLTVLVPPSIVTQPTNETVVAGATAGFQVNVNGTAPLSYQWLFNGNFISTTTTSALTLANVQSNQAGGYSVMITNSAGSTTSAVALLTVLVPPSITQQPASQTTVAGSNITFQASANGSAPLNFQWFFNNTAMSGATSGTLSLTNLQANQAGNYFLIVTNTAGAATSAVAQLTVLIPPSITSQPTNQTTIVGGSANFSVTAAGTAPLGYQWWLNGTNAVGTGTNSLILTNLQVSAAGSYNVVITNSVGSVTSAVATLTVGTPPSISQQPSSQVVVQGQSASFSVGSSGDAPLAYQWRFNGTPVTGATSSNYVFSVSSANAGAYDTIVSNPYGSVTSAVAQLTVLVPPAITAQPTNRTVLAGSTFNFQVNATGSAPLSYQWWFNGTNATGVNTNELTITNAQASQAGGYSVVISNTAGSVTSSVAVLTIGTPPAITQQPSSLVVAQGQNATFSVGATGDAPLNYQWLFNGTTLATTTSSSYGVVGATLTNSGSYQVVVINSYGSATSALAQLSVLIPPAITSQPTNQIVAAGSTVNFQVTVSGTSPLSYQWWFNGTNAVGTSTNTLTLAGVQTTQAGTYAVTVTNSAGSVTSVLASLTIGTAPIITQSPASQSLVQGQNATFNVVGSGTGVLSYQWRFNGSAITSATASSYSISGATSVNAGLYDAIVSNPYGSVTSAVAQLTVWVPPSITSQLTNQTVVLGNDLNFVITAAGTAPLLYQWWFNGTNAVGPDTNVLSLTRVQANQAGTYNVVVTNAAGSITSSVVALIVLVPPSITTQPTNETVGVGGSALFFAGASGSAPLSYQWSLNGSPVAGATNNTLSFINIQPGQAGAYSVAVTNSAGAITSASADLRVLVSPSISSQTTGGSNYSVQVSTVSGLSYSLEYKNALLDPSWTPLTSWVPGTGGVILLQDTNAVVGSRFYRVHCE